MRAAVRRFHDRGAALVHIVAVLSLLVGLLAPLVPIGVASAQGQNGFPPPLPAPSRVAVSGSFETAIGCAADFDPSCPQTQLASRGAGVWTVLLPVPAGSYQFRIVAISDQDRSLGANGDPEGADLSLDVPDGVAGVWFSYNQGTGEIRAEPAARAVEIVTGQGDRIPAAPARQGGYEAFFDAPAGVYDVQVLVDGQPAATDQISLDQPQRVVFETDDNGQVTRKDTVRESSLAVDRTGPGDAPEPGACFAVTDGNTLFGQACDTDDGQADGQTLIRFSDTLNDGDYDLIESQSPTGQTAPEPERVTLGPGAAQFTVSGDPNANPDQTGEDGQTDQPAGDDTQGQDEAVGDQNPVIEDNTGANNGQTGQNGGNQDQNQGNDGRSAPPAGRLVVQVEDSAGNGLPAACVMVLETAQSACDDDNDGQIVFNDLQPGVYTVQEMTPPAGFTPVPPVTAELGRRGARLTLTHDAGTGEGQQPVFDPQDQAPDQGQDQIAAETPSPTTEPVVQPSLDPTVEQTPVTPGIDQGADDQQATETPESIFPADPAGESAALELALNTPDGAPPVGACFLLEGQDNQGQFSICDEDDGAADGLLRFQNLPPGRYGLTETTTPNGFLPAGEQNLTLQAGEDVAASVNYQVADNANALGRLVITVEDPDGGPLGGTCFDLEGPADFQGVCDQGADGTLNFPDIPTGEYTVRQVQADPGFEPAAETTVTVGGGEPARLDLTNARQGEPIPTPTTAPVIAPETTTTPETTEPDATESAQNVANPDAGAVEIQAVDAAGNPVGAGCYALLGPATLDICDNDPADTASNDGVIRLNDVAPGQYDLFETRVPPGLAAAGAGITIDVQAGSGVRVQFAPEAVPVVEPLDTTSNESDQAQEVATETPEPAPTAEPTPTPEPAVLLVTVTDAAGAPLAGACFSLDGPTAIEQRCDDDLDDSATDAGVIGSGDFVPGQYTVSVTPPAGYLAPAPVSLDLLPGSQTTAIALEAEPPATGSLVIRSENASGDPQPGACYDITPENGEPLTLCDDANSGEVRAPELPAGNVQIVQTQQPAGTAAASPAEQSVPISAGAETSLVFQNDPATGGIEILATDPDGAAVGGACFGITGPATGPACDDDTGDGDQTPGRVLLSDLPPGDYTVRVDRPATGFAQTDQTVDLTVVAGETATANFSFEPVPETGSLLVTATYGEGVAAGFCVEAFNASIPDTPRCDNDERDGDPAPDRVLISDLAPGSYDITLINYAPGVALPDPQTVEITAGATTEVTFALALEPTAPGTLRVRAENEAGAPLTGGCYDLTDAAGTTTGPLCDDNGDGAVEFTDVAPGEARLRETTPPVGALPAILAEQSVTVTSGETTDFVFPTMVNPDATAEASETPAAEATPSPEATATPEATTTASPEATPSPAATSTPEVTPEPGEPGRLRVQEIDAGGDPIPLGGACYALSGPVEIAPVCDGGDDDSDPNPARVQISGLPPGAYTLSQTAAPEGYSLAATTRVQIIAAEDTTASVTNLPAPAPTGSLQISTSDPGDSPLGGACYELRDAQDQPVFGGCDNDRRDTDPAPGASIFSGINAGSYTLVQTTAPVGFDLAAPVPVEIVGDQATTVAVTNEAAAPETGSVAFQAVDDAGQPLPDQCFRVTDGVNDVGEYCDNGEGDDDSAPGSLVVTDLPVGSYEAFLAAPDDAGAEAPNNDGSATFQQFANRIAFSVRQGERPAEVRIRRVPRQTNGDFVVASRNSLNQPLAGACFALEQDGGEVASACDNENGDQDDQSGLVRFTDIPQGAYTLTQTRAPAGSETVAARQVRIRGGQQERATVRANPIQARTARIVIRTVDRDDNPVAGACYTLMQGARAIGPVCDEADGADGVTTFNDLQGSAYLVRQTRAPAGYAGGNDTATLVQAGDTREITVEVSPKPGSILLEKVDQNGRSLGGACFQVISVDGGGYDLCDNDPSDENQADGLLLIGAVRPGEYVVRETRAPGGYTPAADSRVQVNPGARATQRVVNVALPAPARRGDLVVTKVDPAGNLLANACWALVQADRTIAGPRCDGDDGGRDGVTRFTGVGVGDYLLRETLAPSAAYQPAADTAVTIGENQITRTRVTNQLRPGRVLVRVVDPLGQPLEGACFTLDRGVTGEPCTNAAGAAVFDNVPVGGYQLTQTRATAGYLIAAPLTGVVVNPAATTVLDVVNQAAPPPPENGTLQLIKFVCPAGVDGEFTAIFDSSNPGASKLGQTAGCALGDARFRLDDLSGQSQSFELSTGETGRRQLTLRAGNYRLTEIAPDLPGEATEEVAISVNQLTTVVVLNFVAPPAPEPGSVEVLKFTCAPGLQGVTFDDFLNACAGSQALTNNVNFRLNGLITARGVTGDSGEQGITRFLNIPAGDYELREDALVNVNQSVYSYCGLDPNAPDLRGAGLATGISIPPGGQVICYFFNVPDLVNDTTGSIVIHKLQCAASAYPPGFDWKNECLPQGAGVRFAVSLLDGDRYLPKATGATDVDGMLMFVDAAPGVYQVKEIGAVWCRAESDSVDAKGDIVVKAGQRANVWIYNCTGTKTPPNTGAGPLADDFARSSAPSPASWSGPPTSLLARDARSR